MKPNSFDNQIVPYLDGELTAEEQAAFELELEASDDLRAAVEFEREFSAFARKSLAVEADAGAKSRLLGALREASSADQSAPDETPGTGRLLPFPVRAIGLPVAAAAAGLLLWLGGVFDGAEANRPSGPEQTQENVFASVMAINSAFDSRVEAQAGARPERLRRVLQTETGNRIWDASSQDERLAELEKMITSCLPHDVPMPRIPEEYELVGYREAELPLESYRFKLPHAVFSTGDKELSIYVLCGSQADAVEEELRHSDNANLKGMSGCKYGGWLARRYDAVLLIFVSKMKFGRMCDFARQF